MKRRRTKRNASFVFTLMTAKPASDVQRYGKNAKPMSKEIVKEYERRQQKLTEKKFNQRKTRGLLRRFMDLFKF